MIYLDTSAFLAQLLAEHQRPPAALWQEPLIASRLLAYEAWTRLHARGLETSHGRAADEFLARIALVELSPLVLRRALEPFPLPVRTLDALHLASIDFLIQRRLDVRLATYDRRLAAAAAAMGVSVYDLA
ncbi:MAG: PIN domain-containing protein [Geminicoccaceae bacterium]